MRAADGDTQRRHSESTGTCLLAHEVAFLEMNLRRGNGMRHKGVKWWVRAEAHDFEKNVVQGLGGGLHGKR
jgi:hypothetical protein